MLMYDNDDDDACFWWLPASKEITVGWPFGLHLFDVVINEWVLGEDWAVKIKKKK